MKTKFNLNLKLSKVILGLGGAVAIALILSVTTAKMNESKGIVLPGTQPKTVKPPVTPIKCFICHEDKEYNNAPATLWRGSMHAMAMKDPLFLASMAVANQDFQNAGNFCIRCHSPRAFLAGRAMPADGSALEDSDKWGITCDFCHRLVDPKSKDGIKLSDNDVSKYENGMYVVSPDKETKRGPYDNVVAPHPTKMSKFHRSGELCGTCHDVTNPINNKPVERTYSEWKQSWYAEQGENGNCQSCHMKNKPGYAVGSYYNYANPYREFLPNHNFNGGSNWIYDTLPYFWNDLDEDALKQGKERANQILKSAASLELDAKKDGDVYSVTVKVTNLTGHKLPTGFPEGRRVWVNLKALDKNGKTIFESGKYDYDDAQLIKDQAAKVYEALPGIKGQGETFHFVLNDTMEKDNRIPPKGFMNTNFEKVGAEVVGYKYADGQYWDETNYFVPGETAKIVATLYYQTATKEYIEFLRDKDKTSKYGKELYEVWKKTGKSAPVLMERITNNLQ